MNEHRVVGSWCVIPVVDDAVPFYGRFARGHVLDEERLGA